MTMHSDNTRRESLDDSFAAALPAELRAVERLLDRLGAHERAQAPFGMEERLTLSGALARRLDELATAEGAMADAGLESRVYGATRRIVAAAGVRLPNAEAGVPGGLEDRIFEATRGTIRGKARGASATARRAPAVRQPVQVSVVGRIGAWSMRLAAVLAIGGGAWLAWSSFRGQESPPGVGPGLPVAVLPAADDDLSLDEFDDVLESHLAFMRTVKYQPAEVEVLDDDWCTSCEWIALEEEISS